MINVLLGRAENILNITFNTYYLKTGSQLKFPVNIPVLHVDILHLAVKLIENLLNRFKALFVNPWYVYGKDSIFCFRVPFSLNMIHVGKFAVRDKTQ